ncbi:DNA adenine methylase [Silvimonas sp.]|uniref:DNA adenine methylase n=1 Tax=Silvimonas sp. TaxID=2650811 RepID=UPI00283CCBA2|nr:DNA adenine methylase [Silvimonas sp.]MDR3427842.1 DNA adenine methylase [Silvimonas sp.]
MTERIKPILRWQGGKSRLLKTILPLIPPHDCYCEAFFGGGAVLFSKERSSVEVINDLNGNLIALYRNLQFHLPALLGELDWLMASRQNLFDFIAQPGLTELQRAARFLLVNRTSFGGGMSSFGVAKTAGGGVGFHHEKIARLIGAAHQRLEGVVVENLSYERCLKNYDSPKTFFFMDPPYEDATNRAYAGWDKQQLTTFRRDVGKLKGNWIVTLNDSPFTRDLFSDCNLKPIVSENRAVNRRTHSDTKFGELVITPK